MSGYKTYLCAVGVALVAAAQYLGWITQDLAELLYGLLGAGAAASLRAGVKKLEG